MKSAYRLFKRRNRPTYYIENTDTGEQKSLGTADRQQAQRLLNAHLEARQSPDLNLQLGRVYITSADPKMATRTWQEAIDELCSRGKPVTQIRYARELKSHVYDIPLQRGVVDGWRICSITKINMFKSSCSFHPRLVLPLWGCVLMYVLGFGFDAHCDDRKTANLDNQAEALLVQMTLDEKVGQMVQVDSGALRDKSDVQKYFLGSILSGGSSDPASGNTAQDWLNFVNEFKGQALQTRLKIPLLYGIDAVHGHNNIDGAVIFPHNIGLGATHNPKLVEQAGRITAEELAGTGIHWTFAPCVAVAQDIRWGRTYESFSDLPGLVSELGAAEVRGLQAPLANGSIVLACPKHFLADGGTQNGVDEGNTVCDEATLRKLFLPPYRAVVEAGAKSIMVSYSSWNGKKMHGNKYLLTDVLKGELGFKGFLVSDWAAIDQISPDYKHDIETAINAGLDMAMIPNGPGRKNNYVEFIRDLKELVAAGRVPQSRIDDAVKRILRAKIELGLFEHPYADPDLVSTIGSAEHRQVARECVRQSLVLLKNERHSLPLSKELKHLVVVGKAADDLGMQCGGWTISWQGDSGPVTHGGTTILSAVRRTVSPETKVTFSPDGSSIAGVDAVIVVVGEMPYAEGKGDRANLDLSAADLALVAKAKSSGTPVVTILLSGRPLILNSALTDSSAFIAAWLPGTEGLGVTDVLFGDFKFTGKLPRTWPRSNAHVRAGDAAEKPLFPFSFGLTD